MRDGWIEVRVKKVKTGTLAAEGNRERIDQRCCEAVTLTYPRHSSHHLGVTALVICDVLHHSHA